MSRSLIAYIVLIVITVGIIIAVDASRPKPVDWTPTYNVNHKIPLGLYVLDHELAGIFNGDSIERLKKTPYEFFDSRYNDSLERYTVKGNFIHISEGESLDRESVQELLYFAEEGNTVFLSMKEMPQPLLDTLKLEINSVQFVNNPMRFTLPYSKKEGRRAFTFNEGAGLVYFTAVDTANTAVLGYQEAWKEKQANFIKVRHGRGYFLLHTQPAAFSNFHLLKDNNSAYAAAVLSYLPKGNIYFFSKRLGGELSQSPLRYVWSQPALKAAVLLSIIGVFIFMIFNARRKQRIIPEIPPVKNTTIEFTRTIGNLYYQEGSHHSIIDKMVIYFLEKLRNEYMMDTYALDDAFTEKLHLKTGRPKEAIAHVVFLIKQHRNRFDSTEKDVITLNQAIEKLKL